MKRLISFVLVFLCILGMVPSVGAVDTPAASSYFVSKNLEKYTFTMGDAEKIGLPFQTQTYRKKDVKTMGTVTARWAKVKFAGGAKASPRLYVPSGSGAVSVTVKDKTIAAKFKNVDGYEWRGVRLRLKFRDSNNKKYGAHFWWLPADYYSGISYEKGAKSKGDFSYNTFTVEKNGEQFTKCSLIQWYTNTKTSSDVYVFVRVPVGYDGATVGLLNIVGRGKNYDPNKASLASAYKKGGIIFRLSDEHKDENPREKREKTLTNKEIRTWYKSTCSKIAYKTLFRYPSKYEGRKIKISGYVLQVSEGGWLSPTVLRVATKGRWDNVFYVEVWGMSTRILEDDKVTIWGEYDGVETYTTIFGGSVTIPAMTAEYYSIK